MHGFRSHRCGSKCARSSGVCATVVGVGITLLDIAVSGPTGVAAGRVDDVEYFDEEGTDTGDAGDDEDHPHLCSTARDRLVDGNEPQLGMKGSGTYEAQISKLAS
jgi:hypothetical protein